jgi:thiamine biosynthesis lipoprotein
LIEQDGCWIAVFAAMASNCEVHLVCPARSEAESLASLALAETRRIEQKYSRYRDDNIVHTLNHATGQTVSVDEETAGLLRFADQCFDLSDGRFDITSGVLRRAWTFDGREAVVDENQIRSLLEVVGWRKVEWTGQTLTLLPGMEIDFGGIGKEYAVDRVAQLLRARSGRSIMVNFGGDIRVTDGDPEARVWTIGIENPQDETLPVGQIELRHGSVATSGDARRYCWHEGKRLGHILNPLTGWPVTEAPRSVTVVADQCLEAGFLSTLAMLHGAEAESFLKAQGVVYHCVR